MQGKSGGSRAGERGAVFVEFIIAFVPVYLIFASILQYALMTTAQVFVEHAATVAARTAALSLGNPSSNENTGTQDQPVTLSSDRQALVRKAVVLTLAPLILDHTALDLQVEYPTSNDPKAKSDASQTFAAMAYSSTPYVRTRVRMQVDCKIPVANRLLCGRGVLGGFLNPTMWLSAESVFPVERATYQPKSGCTSSK